MIEILLNNIKHHKYLLSYIVSVISIILIFFGHRLLKYFFLFSGIITGFVFGSLCGITLFGNMFSLFLFGIIGAIIFAVTFFVYRSVGIYFLGSLFSFAILFFLLKFNIIISLILSLCLGVITVFYKKYSVVTLLSLSGGLLFFISCSIILSPFINSVILIIISSLITIAGISVQLITKKKLKTIFKKKKKSKSEL